MVSRRRLLPSVIFATGVALAGCLNVLDSGGTSHRIDVFNGSQERHVFAVTVVNAAGESIFERTYDLEGRKAVENRVIEGEPVAFTVAIDDDNPIEFQWSPDKKECSNGTTTSLAIYFQLESDPDITPIYECNTITDREEGQ